jgi:hypothetical protein
LRRVRATRSIRRLQGITEFTEPEQRDFGEKSFGVFEVVRRRGRRNASSACGLPQGKAIHAALQDDLLGHREKLLPQIAMVIGRSRRLTAARFNLDTVQISL